MPGSTAEKVGWLKFDCAHSELVALGHVVPLLIILEFFFFFFTFCMATLRLFVKLSIRWKKIFFFFTYPKFETDPQHRFNAPEVEQS